MLGFEEAMYIRNFVNNHLFDGESVLSLEDAANMHPLPGTRNEYSYTVLGIQVREKSILVWVKLTDRGLRIRQAKLQEW